MPSMVNRLIVKELTSEFQGVDGFIFVSWGKLNAVENEGLRDKLAEKGAKLMLVRNSLARLVLKEQGFEVGADVLVGNTAIAYGDVESMIHAAKAFTSPEVKKIGKVKLRAAVLEGRLLDAKDAAAVAEMPDKHTLRTKMASVLIASPRGLVTLVNQVPTSLVRALKARAEQLEKAGGAAAPAG